MKPHLSALFQLAPHILSGMRHAGLLVFLAVAICSTSACAGNGNAYGYDNGKAYGHDQSDSDKGAPNDGWSGGSGATASGSMPVPAIASIALSTRLVQTWFSSPA